MAIPLPFYEIFFFFCIASCLACGARLPFLSLGTLHATCEPPIFFFFYLPLQVPTRICSAVSFAAVNESLLPIKQKCCVILNFETILPMMPVQFFSMGQYYAR
uniref:Uncharacterized protein n=1 Tax=Ixodes scapularis TaxID=6945 RepID=A0A4D5S3M6_IXOSC